MATYNRNAAVAYAAQWWNGHNPAYVDYDNDGSNTTSDCANFVSQCLLAGGMPMKYTTDTNSYDSWYYKTPGQPMTDKSGSWAGANSLRLFIKYNTVGYPRMGYTFLSDSQVGQLQKGDLVFALSGTGDKTQREATHVAMVNYVLGDNIYVFAHSVAKGGTNPQKDRWTPTPANTIFCKFDGTILLSGGSGGGTTTFPPDVVQNSAKTGRIITVTDPLRIRKGPGTSFAEVGRVAKNSLVTYYTTTLSTQWYYVVQGAVRGYGSASYIAQV